MVLKTFTFLLLFLNTEYSFSQSGWNFQISNTSKNLYSVIFLDSNTGYCSGDSGKILKTTNGGTNWIEQSSGYLNKLRTIDFISSNTGYAAGDNSILLKTTNGGKIWIRLSLNCECYLTSLSLVSDSLGFIGGNNNKVYKIFNGGNSFDSVVPPGVEYATSIHFINSNTGWVTGQNGIISYWSVVKTTDGGLSWIFPQNFSSTYNSNSVFFIDSLYGWLGSPASPPFGIPCIYRTTNGGMNWISPPNSVFANSIFFIDQNNGWAACPSRNIYLTTNSGINWNIQLTPQLGNDYNSICFINESTGWVVGDSGVILKTTTGGILTNFTNTESEVPDRFFLAQNYPNPFNPATDLKFGISKLGFVSLKIYDMLGKEVAALVNSYLNAGTYNYQLSTDNYQLTSGVYFYKLTVDGNIIDTKRMVLLK